jgi:glycosyltransferase involved in cell wall biosynthesis
MLVTAVIPAYNASSYLAEAVRSVLEQTHTELELIVIDDGSTDDTVEVARAAFGEDHRAQVHSFENVGLPGARSRGLALAKGEFLAQLDADDRWLPEKLEMQVAALEAEPETVCVGCFMRYIGEDGHVLRGPRGFTPTTGEDPRDPRSQALIRQALLLPFPPSAITYRTEILRLVGGWDATIPTYGEDFELLARIGELGTIGVVPESLAEYRLHIDSMTADDFSARRRYMMFVIHRHQARMAGRDLTFEQFEAEYHPTWRERRLARAHHHVRKAGTCLLYRRYLAAAGHLGASLVMRPSYPLARVHRSITGKRQPPLLRGLPTRVQAHPDTQQ